MPDWFPAVLGIVAIAMSLTSLEMNRRNDERARDLEEKIAILEQLRRG